MRQSSPAKEIAMFRRLAAVIVRCAPSAPWWSALALACLVMGPAHAAPDAQPFSRMACYNLVQREGRMIAWGRWEQGYSLERMSAGRFDPGTPEWMVTMVRHWIEDAYSWHATDEQVRQWAEELGNTANLPAAGDLTRDETIAIWMRRIARECAQQPAT
jgi:hypothetical protein